MNLESLEENGEITDARMCIFKWLLTRRCVWDELLNPCRQAIALIDFYLVWGVCGCVDACVCVCVCVCLDFLKCLNELIIMVLC